MPVIFRYKGIRFFFYSNEGNPLEPIHVHAESGDGEAKIWLEPQVAIASSAGYNRKQLSQLMQLVEEHRRDIEEAWNEHFRQDRQL
ncbi:DUF4160 domain-containing protein [Halomonas halodenitrificans]|uniref:DUF4160 domain-containing protein n=1 Tax=Halomonas halodenitrificans TaxID=28252 RepID=UPI00048977D8|nr:DUF4160 domain-containing protein [Halomonas halodenitrificans]